MSLTSVNDDSHFTREFYDHETTEFCVVSFTSRNNERSVALEGDFAIVAYDYPLVKFLEVDIDKCRSTASILGIHQAPTFALYFGGVRLDLIEGETADRSSIRSRVARWYRYCGAVDPEMEWSDKLTGIPNYMNLVPFMEKISLLQNPDTLYNIPCHKWSNYRHLCSSDDDSRFLISITFDRFVQLHAVRIRNLDSIAFGPKFIKFFGNAQKQLGFHEAERRDACHKLELSPIDLSGRVLPLNSYSLADSPVHNLQIFVQNNQSGGPDTKIESMILLGRPLPP